MTTVLVDDLEGESSDNVDMDALGCDGAHYEISLRADKPEKLATALAPYIRARRRTESRSKACSGNAANSRGTRTDKE